MPETVENWLILGEWFRIPVQVTWPEGPHTIAKVRPHPDVSLLRCQRAIAHERLTSMGAWPDGDAWFITAESLDEIASPCDSTVTDPEELLQWSPQNITFTIPVEGEVMKAPAGAPDRREFLKAFVDTWGLSGFETIEQLETFYLLLCQFMASWIIERNKPVHLVFAKLFAAPFETNWQNRIDLVMKGVFRNRVSKQKTEDHLWRALYDPRLRKVRRGTKQEFRSLQFILTDEWWRMTEEGEGNRTRHLREWRYLRLIDNRLRDVLPLLREVYEQYRREEGLSTVDGTYRDLGRILGTGKIKFKRPGSRAGSSAETIALLKSYQEREWRHRRKKRKVSVDEANEVVLPVQPVQPKTPDLRDVERAPVAAPGNGDSPAQGVFMPYGPQGGAEVGPVLEQGAGQHNGVAGPVDGK